MQASICVKKEDVYVSRSILEEGAWEEENVVVAMKAMDYYQDAVFIGKTFILTVSYQICFSTDAGSNIGMYTIMMAAMDRKVIAVDAMVDNLAYIRRSLKLDNKESLVTLAHNAVR